MKKIEGKTKASGGILGNKPGDDAVPDYSREDISVILVCGARVEFCSLSGVVKKSLSFSSEVEGLPHAIALGGTTLVASTSRQMLKLWNIARSLGGKKLMERRFEDAKTGEKYGDI